MRKVRKVCNTCKYAGETFESAYDGRLLKYCEIRKDSKRPHGICSQWEAKGEMKQ